MPPAHAPTAPGLPDAARQELVRSHLPLVRAIARRYSRRRDELDDLVQAGSLGLVKASSRFDPDRGVAFATFAAPSVEGEIRRHLRERDAGVRIPREVQRMSTELRRCRSELAASLGRAPDVRELAAALDADTREVERLLAADVARDAAPLGTPGTDAPADNEALAKSEYRVLLAGGLRTLAPRERRIVFLRFHADMTERQIARTVGISQAHVSRLLEGALTKLRAELTSSADRGGAGDSTETTVISPDSSSNVEPVGARRGEDEQDETAPAQASGESARRSSKSRAPNGYSGRILVRMPSELHAQLAQAAERDDVSLNRFVNDALSSSVGGSDSRAAAETAQSEGHSPRARAIRLAVATNLAVVIIAGVAAVVLLVFAIQRGV
ncbi:MAG TPA: sigma-70 family RNA polymerase sigma factor [Solirubrobacteraceae bacterium]|nr:sigma-70 family RNA polymerase sigma factor [Solirubrobacteraceae bacterium]